MQGLRAFAARYPLRGSAWSMCENWGLVLLLRCARTVAIFFVRAYKSSDDVPRWHGTRRHSSILREQHTYRKMYALRPTCARSSLRRALAQSNLHRPVEQSNLRGGLAQSNLRRALAQSNLRRPTFKEHFHSSTCAMRLRKQLGQSNSHRALA